VLTVVLAGLLCVVALLGVAIGGLLVGHRRAAAAADLAALAGAGAQQQGRSGWGAARATAAANDARLTGCSVRGGTVTVEVVRDVRSAFGRTVRVSSRARAGPVG
jgi:secretion/DNA translocation related TadE-like protein